MKFDFMSLLKWPKLIVAGVYEKIEENAKRANQSVKEFVGDEKNIANISAVVYDILPLAVKLGLRYERFHQTFKENFTVFRNKIYSYEQETAVAHPSGKVADEPPQATAAVPLEKSTDVAPVQEKAILQSEVEHNAPKKDGEMPLTAVKSAKVARKKAVPEASTPVVARKTTRKAKTKEDMVVPAKTTKPRGRKTAVES